MIVTRKEALLMVDRAMVRIRRSQSRRTIGHLMRQRLGPQVNLGNIAVADALQELAEGGDQEPTIGQMAERLGIDPSRASRMTAGAIRVGFVKRIASQSDGRRSHLELTSAGLKALETTRRFRTSFFAHLMSDWSARDCAEFAKLLIRFTESLPRVSSTKASRRQATLSAVSRSAKSKESQDKPERSQRERIARGERPHPNSREGGSRKDGLIRRITK
jgi:DNA-binding MarR family transcriptional regulator